MWSQTSGSLKPQEGTGGSTEEEVICSLRTQLALHQELCTQFKIDLGARDELVAALTNRLEARERENDKRRRLARSWKKKTSNMEKLCHQLEEHFHDQVARLERDKSDLELERNTFSSELLQLRAYIQQLQKDSATKEVTIVQLNKQLDQKKEDIDGLNIALESKQQELELVKRKHGPRGAVGSTLGHTANVAPSSKAPRASAISAVDIKTKLFSRRASITSMPIDAEYEKENTSTAVTLKHPRRTTIPP